MRDDDEDGSIRTTRGNNFDCRPDEVYAFDWSLMQYWADLVMREGKIGDSKVSAIIDAMRRHGRYGDLSLFGIRQYGQDPACVAAGPRGFSCPVDVLQPVATKTNFIPSWAVIGGDGFTLGDVNFIEEGLPEARETCVILHEQVHSAQIKRDYNYPGGSFIFTGTWIALNLLVGDSQNIFEVEALAISGCT